MFCLQSRSYIMLFWLFIFLTMVITVTPTYAVNQANQQTVDIKAKYLLLDENKGISTYKGKVLFTKDTLTIQADTVTLYYDGKKLIKAVILGSPADVQHEPDNEANVHSQANKMEYFIDQDKLTLKGRAFVDQGSRRFSGEHIEYDTRQRIITAAGNQSSIANAETSNKSPENKRIHVIIGPDEDTDEAENIKNNAEITSDEE